MPIRSVSLALLLSACATLALAAGEAEPAKAAEAAEASEAGKPQATAAADEGSKMICKRERAVGSLIPARICKTAAQWEAEREQSRKMMQDLQQRTGSTGGR